jgi:hypothetical protein
VWGVESKIRKTKNLQDPRAKDRWGSQWLTPNGDRPANGSPTGHRLTPNGGRSRTAKKKEKLCEAREDDHGLILVQSTSMLQEKGKD